MAATRKKCKAIYFILTLNIIASLWAATCEFLKLLSVRSPLVVKNANVPFILRNLVSLAWKTVSLNVLIYAQNTISYKWTNIY